MTGTRMSFEDAAKEFLAQEQIAVAGVSRARDAAANVIYRKLRASGRAVFAINPNAERVEGDACYPSVASLPVPVGGVVVATHPSVTDDVIRQCGGCGIRRVWVHRSIGPGSLSDTAVITARATGVHLIPGGCPMMYCEPVDAAHRCMRWILKRTGGLPRIL